MGWSYTQGSTRKSLINERTTDWERTKDDGLRITSRCLAHCFRGNNFTGVLWSVWERTFTKGGQEADATQRWIQCDLLQYERGCGWGYKDMEESMHPYYYSCPLKYLRMVPIEEFGGNAEWRKVVHEHHQRRREKRKERTPVRSA